MWVWERDNWPNLSYDAQRVLPHLEKCVQTDRTAQNTRAKPKF